MTDLTTHMLGYLNHEHWVDAVQNHGYSRERVEDLIEQQQEQYGGTLLEDFRAELGVETE